MKKPILQRTAIFIGAFVLLLWTLTPFYWAMNMGLKWHTEVLDGSLVPRHPTLANILRLADIPHSAHVAACTEVQRRTCLLAGGDVFGAPSRSLAEQALKECAAALEGFAARVLAAEERS